jgi:hypothetical protein
MTGTLAAMVAIASSVTPLPGLPSFPVRAESVEQVRSLLVDPPDQGASKVQSAAVAAGVPQDLASIVRSIPPVSQETQVRRDVAQATFCLPQNVLGILYYALLQLTGNVVGTAEMNEMRIIVTRTPFGVSLGRFLFVNASMLTESTVRHEYGHTMQGYRHGPFFLLVDGLPSFVQAGISLISRPFADTYFDRWPENEADALGGVTRVGAPSPEIGSGPNP